MAKLRQTELDALGIGEYLTDDEGTRWEVISRHPPLGRRGFSLTIRRECDGWAVIEKTVDLAQCGFTRSE